MYKYVVYVVLVILAPWVFLLKLKTSVILPKTSYQDQCSLILSFSFTVHNLRETFAIHFL